MRYHFLIENTTRVSKEAVVLGHNDYVLSGNFGNDIGISVKLLNNNANTYLQLLQESSYKHNRTDIFRFITDSWEKMPKGLRYVAQRADGFIINEPISLVTNKWGVEKIPNKAVNDVRISKDINGTSSFAIKIYPKSEVELIIIEKQ